MRILPRSLFSRLVIVFLTGLVISQVLSLAIILQDRGELISRASGMQTIQRITDIVRLLDSTTASDRPRILSVLNSPAMRIANVPEPARLRPDQTTESTQSAIFLSLLHRRLGADRPINLDVHAATAQPDAVPPMMRRREGGPSAMQPGPGMGRYFSGPVIALIAQIRLDDGTWVTFDSQLQQEAWNWPYRAIFSVLILLLGVVLLSLIGVRWMTKPLKILAHAAEKLGKNIDTPPLDESGPLEVARAANAMNNMQQRLSRYINDRTRVLAAMSHDLKTPITRMRLRAELLEDTALRDKFSKDLTDLETMVNETLDFMRGVGSGEASRQVDINALLESIQMDVQDVGKELDLQGSAQSTLECRPQALKRCLSNLIDNAIRYGKVAHVVLLDTPESVQIVVRDEGPGVPEELLPRLFEPFYRLEASRNRDSGGTGLGLGIARSIAEQHGGTLTLRNGSNGGLEARLTLPR